MIISEKQIDCLDCRSTKIFIEQDGKEIARAYLYLIKNDLRTEPYGLMEDVFVDESMRGQGLGTELVKKIISLAKLHGCYKIIATSRYGREEVHKLYEKLGFKNFGIEYKMYLEGDSD
jgi:GNAT superfamily N-acetyltransferase